MQDSYIKSISVSTESYPAVFRQLMKPPQTIYTQGDTSLYESGFKRLAIVGARRMTPYGKIVTRSMVKAVSGTGTVIVSGLALGIDSEAHRAALDFGCPTISVLPGSINRIYPARHRGLAQTIVRHGGLLVSEYKDPLRQPFRHQFIERNRLIAALADVVLVVEADLDSGSRHTVDYAVELNREVGLIPGNITSNVSAGTNQMIRDGLSPVTGTADLLMMLGLNEKKIKRQHHGENEVESAILEILRDQSRSSEDVTKLSGLTAELTNIHLSMLEIKGMIHKTGGVWSIV